MTEPSPVVILVDIDNTLLDNDRIQEDFKRRIEREMGTAARDRYWTIVERLFTDLGYRDYIGALQEFRVGQPQDMRLFAFSRYVVDYPFAGVLYPRALDVLKHLRGWGPTVVVSDGDAVFQPRKAERSGIAEAADGQVLIYIHKELELDDIAKCFPAEHYVFVDDKLRILSAVKKIWGSRVTTVFPRQGMYAFDPQVLKTYPPADVTVEKIGDLLGHSLKTLLAAKS
jgi:FMN phosphatase YigB (HAD superfamily)